MLLVLLPAAANAYTLVLRSGRHVNVPDNFHLTHRAVIYEASPGFTVTVWLTNIDVAATEKANAEPAGGFAARMKQGPAVRTAGDVKKVVTNKDLEPSRLRREAQEAEYERTHRERGLPSRQELQRHFEEQDRRLHESALQIEKERAEAELESLRAELVAVRRDLYELNLRLSRPEGDYVTAYVSPSFYPYYYAPPFQFIKPFRSGHRGGYGRANFVLQTRWRARPHNPRQGRPFPSLGGPSLHRGIPPRVPAKPAFRR